MQHVILYASAVTAGVLLGIIGGPVYVLLVWALAGLVLGALSNTRSGSAIAGALFGFSVAYVFMIAGYSGSAALVTRLVPFAALGLFGALCGTILGMLGSIVHRLARPRG